jgi:hypothetical protein
MVVSTKTIAVLAIALAVGLGLLVVLSGTYLSVGLGLLDGCLNGYDGEAVNRYLVKLSAESCQFYIGASRTLDIIIPLVLATTFAAIIWRLGSFLWRTTVFFSLIYVIADLRDNALVELMLQASTFDVGTLSAASDMTQLKWLFPVLSLAVFLWLWRQGRIQL